MKDERFIKQIITNSSDVKTRVSYTNTNSMIFANKTCQL